MSEAALITHSQRKASQLKQVDNYKQINANIGVNFCLIAKSASAICQVVCSDVYLLRSRCGKVSDV